MKVRRVCQWVHVQLKRWLRLSRVNDTERSRRDGARLNQTKHEKMMWGEKVDTVASINGGTLVAHLLTRCFCSKTGSYVSSALRKRAHVEMSARQGRGVARNGETAYASLCHGRALAILWRRSCRASGEAVENRRRGKRGSEGVPSAAHPGALQCKVVSFHYYCNKTE